MRGVSHVQGYGSVGVGEEGFDIFSFNLIHYMIIILLLTIATV